MSTGALISTVQLQEPGDALIELFELTLPNETTTVYFVNGLEDGTDNIYFSNTAGTTLNEYVAIPIQIEGLEIASRGAQNRPTLSMANIPVLARTISNTESTGDSDEETLQNILDDAGLVFSEDLLGARITFRRTLQKHLQSAGDTAEVPVEFPSATFILDRVAAENNVVVSFELASPMDVEGVLLPGRVIIGKYCPWQYQGDATDQYGGCTWPTDSDGRFFDIDDNVITRDIATISAWSNSATYSATNLVKTTTNSHTKIWEALRSVPANKDPETQAFYWKRKDVCGKLINSCKIRFQGNNTDATLNTGVPIPFGGFPGSKKFK